MRRPTAEDETLRLTAESGLHGTLTALWEGGSVVHPLPAAREWSIGRSGAADVLLDHPSISRKHLTVRIHGCIHVTDLGSSNGTTVRGQRLTPGDAAMIESGEAFEIGKLVLFLRPRGKAEKRSLPQLSAMQDVWRLVDLAAPTDIPILLLGETGSGKGYLAERIHARSTRAAGPWLHLNCAALPGQLLESELFGHERGAFTGALEVKPGLFEVASGGTLFLDEIAELPLGTQAKLLTAIERGEVLRVGGVKPRTFDVRIIAATNRPMEGDRVENLRPDLYFRLAGMPITLPALRERKDEMAALVAVLLKDAAESLRRPVPELGRGTLVALLEHDWPGNVRELASLLKRAVLCSQGSIEVEQLGLPQRAGVSTPLHRLSLPPAPASSRRSLSEDVSAVERERILEALDTCGGNQSRAAEMLGISRRTLINRMIAFSIPRPRKG